MRNAERPHRLTIGRSARSELGTSGKDLVGTILVCDGQKRREQKMDFRISASARAAQLLTLLSRPGFDCSRVGHVKVNWAIGVGRFCS